METTELRPDFARCGQPLVDMTSLRVAACIAANHASGGMEEMRDLPDLAEMDIDQDAVTVFCEMIGNLRVSGATDVLRGESGDLTSRDGCWYLYAAADPEVIADLREPG